MNGCMIDGLMDGQSSETDSEVDWGVVDVTKRQEFVDSDSESDSQKRKQAKPELQVAKKRQPKNLL